MIKGWGRPLYSSDGTKAHWIQTNGMAICGRHIGYSAVPHDANRCQLCERRLAEQRERARGVSGGSIEPGRGKSVAGLPEVYLCPECKRSYNEPAMLAAVAPEEREFYGVLGRAIARHPEHGRLAGYQWYCGCDAVCFCPWGNEFLRFGIQGQPEPIVIGHLSRSASSPEGDPQPR